MSRIEIDPGNQGRGIGTRIISALADQAERTGQDLVLDVLTVNRRAQALYQRLVLTEGARHATASRSPCGPPITASRGRPDRCKPGDLPPSATAERQASPRRGVQRVDPVCRDQPHDRLCRIAGVALSHNYALAYISPTAATARQFGLAVRIEAQSPCRIFYG